MRGVWWSAFALLLLAVATDSIRSAQEDGGSRNNRRLPSSSRSLTSTNKPEDVQSTPIPRVSRRGERHEDVTPRDISRTRHRSKPPETTSTVASDLTSNQSQKSERFDSRRTSTRTRNRPAAVNEENFDTTIKRENQIKSRSRQITRHPPSSTTQAPTVETSSFSARTQTKVTDSTTFLSKNVSEEAFAPSKQFRRRSSSAPVTELITPMPSRTRGRVNTRTNIRTLDLDVSGTANALTTALKEPTTARSNDLRNPRKLRYKTRPAETDTNLTGEGIVSNEVKSSQSRENVTSQPELKSFSPSTSTTERSIRQNTEKATEKTTTAKASKIIKRPVYRAKAKGTAKSKVSDEIGEDDNYPPSFKALIQAKNASTQASSPPSESLSVKASQKVFNTHPTSPQLIITAPDTENHSRLRSKINLEDDNEIKSDESTQADITPFSESPKARSIEYRLRGSFTPRNKKSSTFSSSTSSTKSFSPVTQSSYKFSRKFKASTTEILKTENTPKYSRSENSSYKPVARSFFPRRNVTRNFNVSTSAPKTIDSNKNVTEKSANYKSKQTLPRTSYYARLRNKAASSTLSTISSVQDVTEAMTVVDKKSENTADTPIILTYTNNPTKPESESLSKESNENQSFIINVNSKESLENGTDSEVASQMEASQKNPIINVVTTTQKYHATYKEKNNEAALKEKEKNTVTIVPPIRNIQTRKYSRKLLKRRDPTTPRSKERNIKKYSDTFSKTTEASSNGILAEPEKTKNKFSSKYRASYLDKPFYKPTVPTVTPSTAWLKFFVTDHLLTKSVEEPNWFEEDFSDVTTEQMLRPNSTSPICVHEPALVPVEGEETQIGPDMNVISFTKTASPPISADLRLSENLAKPLQVMNVEASNHSPSVTVSIFDALAEILTSTPKPQISTTTSVTQNQNNNNEVKLTPNGVSSNSNVNSVESSKSQDTSTIVVNTIANPVQTEQTTPNVFNRVPVEGTATPSQINEDEKTSVNTPSTLPSSTPLSTTPFSARRPFAIKVLYADTDPTTDRTTAVFTATQPPTDRPTTVYNKVSDLILSNNRLVSSGLTSMLSDNIKSIIQNMDDDSKARLSVDMVKLLDTIIPKLSSRSRSLQNDRDSIPDTTPYSLEDIRDTENIQINNDDDDTSNTLNENILQNVGINIVNSTEEDNFQLEVATTVTDPAVNGFSSQDSSDNMLTAPTESTQNVDTILTSTLANTGLSSSTSDLGVFIVNADSNPSLSVNEVTNKPDPVPFLTNFELNDFDSDTLNETNMSSNLTKSLQLEELENIDNIQDPRQLSRLQLWILSKKARVLKMIEELIRNHNDEIANASLTELISDTNQNNVSLSNRLTEIVNTMRPETTTIITSDNSNNDEPTPTTVTNTIMTTTFSSNPTPPSLLTTEANLDMPTTSIPIETASPSLLEKETMASQTASQIADALSTTTSMAIAESTTVESKIRSMDLVDTTTTSTNAEIIEATTLSIPETTIAEVEPTTEPSVTIENNVETTITSGTETTTIALPNMTNSNGVNTVSQQLNVATPPPIPKKDYVIFGILPNNTVVRKDPNDDALETLTEASPYIIYGVLPNNTVIRKFPNGTRVPRIMQKIDILPISPWSLRNPYSPIHNIPAIVRPRSNLIRVSTNTVTSTDTSNNGSETKLTIDTVNNLQNTISSSALNIKDSSSLGITTSTNKPPAEISTASHVLSLRTTTMLPSVDEILLNSISLATKEEMFISSMTSSTREPRILTLDIDPETKQIRTEKPDDGNGNTVFKFIPIDEVTASPQESNVLKLASTKMPKVTITNEMQRIMPTLTTESNTQTQKQNYVNINDFTAMIQNTLASETPVQTTSSNTESSVAVETTPTPTTLTTTSAPEATETIFASIRTSESPVIITPETPISWLPITTAVPTVTTQVLSTTDGSPSTTAQTTGSISQSAAANQRDTELLQAILQQLERRPKNLNAFSGTNQAAQNNQIDNTKLLQAILAVNTQPTQTTTTRSIEDDIRQFQEDTRLLKALLIATGRNPADLNLPTLDNIRATTTTAPTTPAAIITTQTLPPTTTTTTSTTTMAPTTTTTTTTMAPTTTTTTTTMAPTTTTTTTTMAPSTTTTTTTTMAPTTTTTTTTTMAPTTTTTTTTNRPTTVRSSTLDDDIQRLREDTKLLQALLQATGNQNTGSLPIISGGTSNLRIASNPLTTSLGSNPTTPVNVRPVYTTRPLPVFTNSLNPGTFTVSTLQPQQSSTEEIGISTTFRPFNERATTTVRSLGGLGTTTRAKSARFTVTTEMPSTSTFSDEEDLLFLQNLKSVLSTQTGDVDPETALANRVIALAVERSLNEIQGGTNGESSTTSRPSTTTRPTTTRPTTTRPTTTRRTTTTERTTTTQQIPPSLEADIKQFEEDTKLLQALLKATGQDPSKFNIPTLPNTNKVANNERPSNNAIVTTTNKPYGAKIAVKDDLKNEQDDAKLLKTLIKIQDAQETTTLKGKIPLTGQTSDEALKKLINAQPAGMVPEATKSSISLSTEYGNSNDALLAALLKEQGFGPTTASSLDEQLRLSALLNQVVVTPKARRTTTPPPPPPAPRRPILDGLAWLWQQWRETAPGSGESRPNRRPASSARPSVTPSEATSSRVNWFGSGPFVGNADEQPSSSNRIPLEPPSVVASEQAPARGQLVSAAINMTRALSQFLGAAIQGAAQTVQSVFRAGRVAATDAYTGGSG